MCCILCGKDLYEEMSFSIIFKMNYVIHLECENSINCDSEYMVFPLFDKLVMFDYLFPKRFDESNEEFLFTKYFGEMMKKSLKNIDWSILLIADVVFEEITMILVTKLVEKKILILSVFNESFL